MLDIEFAQRSDPGPVRTRNEDYLGHVAPGSAAQARSHGWLFVLADGVGGHRQGEIASRAAVEEMVAGFRRAPAGEPPNSLINRLVQASNARICETEALAGPAGTGMASTIVACMLRFDRATIAHVGDSRCYLIRRGEIQQITRDHTVAAEQQRLGLLSQEEAQEAESRHVLSRSLGLNLFVNVEIDELSVLPGDVLLLCSDGLHGPVRDAQMARTVSQSKDLDAAARQLIDRANQQDGDDNVSVQLIRVRSVERVGMYRGRPYNLR
jgi:protein phosphatase